MRLGVSATVTLNHAIPSLMGLRLVILEPVAERLAAGNPWWKCLDRGRSAGAGRGTDVVGFA